MWTRAFAVETTAPAAAIFALYRDVATWPAWDAGLERMLLDGPFASGTTGSMLLLDQDPLATRLLSVEDGRGFEDETRIPGTDLVVRVRHTLDPLPHGGTRVTHSLSIDGPDADTLGPSVGEAITADFPRSLAALVALAEAATVPRCVQPGQA
jgi:hypothetical protein